MREDLQLSNDEVLTQLRLHRREDRRSGRVEHAGRTAQQWFGKTPPDLSLEARAKGPDWIYNYLKSFYLDPSRPVGWNNTVFPNASMPNVLWELQGSQRRNVCTGQAGRRAQRRETRTGAARANCPPHEFDQTARDITTFLQYVGEPAALKRESIGVWVILYLAFFTFLAWLLKHEYWKDVH